MIEWIKMDCDIEGDYQPPFFVGSMLRGVIGNALKRVVCINPGYKCEGCFALQDCLYYQFYEEKNIFHPYRLGISLQPKTLGFSFYLFEDAVKSLPYVLAAIKKAFEELGVGRERVKMKVKSIRINNQKVYEDNDFMPLNDIVPNSLEIDSFCQDVTLQFTTPIRIKEDNQFARTDFRLATLINNIHHRYQQLRAEESARLGYQVHGEIVRSDLKFVEMQRFSNRQKSRMNLGGLKGTVSITGLDKQSYIYLKIGEIIGAGKQTVFGLGSYIIKEER